MALVGFDVRVSSGSGLRPLVQSLFRETSPYERQSVEPYEVVNRRAAANGYPRSRAASSAA